MADKKKIPESSWIYSNTVKDHFFNPRNFMKDEDEKKFKEDGLGYVGSPECGDMMKIWIKIDKEKDIITDIKWSTFGCASAIASTSVMSEMVKGMKLDKAMKITPQDIMKELGGLPKIKVHCSVLGDKALRAAINDYYKRSGQEKRVKEEKAQVICTCLNVSDHDIEEAVLDGAFTFEKVQYKTKVGTGCGNCIPRVKKMIKMYKEKHFGKE